MLHYSKCIFALRITFQQPSSNMAVLKRVVHNFCHAGSLCEVGGNACSGKKALWVSGAYVPTLPDWQPHGMNGITVGCVKTIDRVAGDQRTVGTHKYAFSICSAEIY